MVLCIRFMWVWVLLVLESMGMNRRLCVLCCYCLVRLCR